MARLHQQHQRLPLPILPCPFLQGNRRAPRPIQPILQVRDGEGDLILLVLAVVRVPDNDDDGTVLKGHGQRSTQPDYFSGDGLRRYRPVHGIFIYRLRR